MARKPTRARALGVSDDDYRIMLAAQNGHCALCPNTPKIRRLHADHDHDTEQVRGLLCHRCNRNLPTWVTSEWLRRAAAYLDGNTSTVIVWPDGSQSVEWIDPEISPRRGSGVR